MLPQSVNRKQLRELPKELPEGLLDQFRDGTKNPISCVMEYCASARLHAE